MITYICDLICDDDDDDILVVVVVQMPNNAYIPGSDANAGQEEDV